MKKLIVFDLDDTLIPSSQGYEFAYRAIGIDSCSEDFQAARSLVKSRLPVGHTSCHNRGLYLKAFLEQMHQFSPRRWEQLLQDYEAALAAYLSRYWDQHQRHGLFQRLREKADLAIITNENLRSQLLKLNVIDPDGSLFSHVVISEEFGVEKPAAVLFQEVAQRFDTSTTITMVGNEVDADLAPARELGWRTVLMEEFLTERPVSGFDVSYVRAEDLLKEVQA